MALPKANRHPHALLIFIPTIILGLLWRRVTAVAGMSTGTEALFSFLVESLTIGIAVLWLHADKLGRYWGWAWFTRSLGILFLADLVVLVSYGGTFPRDNGLFLTFTTITGAVLLVALALARWLARQRYQPLRFLLWLAGCSVACSFAGAVAFLGVLALSHPSSVADLSTTVVRIVRVGLVFSLCLYALNLPYMLLMFSSPFFRRRFGVWLGTEPLPPDRQHVPGAPRL